MKGLLFKIIVVIVAGAALIGIILVMVPKFSKVTHNTNITTDNVDHDDYKSEVNLSVIRKISKDLIKGSEKESTKDEREVLNELSIDIDSLNGDAKKLAALMLATDISIGQVGMMSQDMLLYMSGKALEGYPDHPIVTNNVASVMFDNSESDKAISLYKEALKVSPDNTVILCNLANAYIQKGDFGSAQKYATQSLGIDPNYTVAYQILTTVHLKNGNDYAAAETLIKSAANCFNVLSIHQFDSFLGAISYNPEDEFPLEESVLDNLYNMVKQEGEEVDEVTDTPNGQIEIKEFPKYKHMKDFGNSAEEFHITTSNILEKWQESLDNSLNIVMQKNSYLYGNERIGIANGSTPVISALKQYYAMEIMTAYYKYQMTCKTDELYQESVKDFDENFDKRADVYDKYTKIQEDHYKKYEAYEEAGDYERAAIELELSIKAYYDMNVAVARVVEEYFPKYYNNKNRLYNEIKQLCEEYWLKSGGIIKYVSDESTYKYLSYTRDELVYSNLFTTINGMGADADMFAMYAELLGDSPYTETVKLISFEPNIDYPPLPKYKEKNDRGWELGLSVLSLSYSNQEYKLKINTPYSTHMWTKSLYDGRNTSASAYGVQPLVGTLAQVLIGNKRYEDLKEKAWKYGINMPKNLYEGKNGTYITRDSNGRVIDRGKYNVYSIGLDVPVVDIKFEYEKESMNSYITGVVEVNRGRTFSFKGFSMK